MPIARVQMPDGRIARLEVPEGATPEQVESFAFNMANPAPAKPAEAPKPAVVSAGETIRQIPRQVGLTARYGIEGVGDVVGIGSEPIRTLLNPVLRSAGLPSAPSARDTAGYIADLISLPKPETPTERVVGDATRLMAGSAGIAGLAGKIKQLMNLGPVATKVAETMASRPGQQVVAAGTAGASGGSVREAGGGPVEQFVASMAGGLAGAAGASAATKLYDSVSTAIKSMLTPQSRPQDVSIVLNQILAKNGIDTSKLAGSVRADLAAEVKRALDTGKELNPEVIRRIADYGVVKATPTRGTVTLDPVQISQEKNLAKIGANSSDPNLQTLAQTQNANNRRLIENLNELGGAKTNPNTNPVVAGQKVVGAVQARDSAAQATERALYNRARDSAGRAIELDSTGFVGDAYNRLAADNKGGFLPEQIKNVLEQLRVGKQILPDGTEAKMPFTVDTIDNIKTMLATAQRGAADGNVRRALSLVRSALDDVQPVAQGRPVGGNQVVDPAALSAAQTRANTVSKDALDAFDKARRFAAARRNWQESAPAFAAALDDPNPDRFVKDFIISQGGKAQTANVERLMFTVRRNPEAMQAVRDNIVGYLKKQALSGADDEVGNFSASGFRGALNEIGDMKLRLFFTPEQIAQLKAVGRVASYETVQPRGSAVNNSNTAPAIAGILDKIANNQFVGRLPFGDVAIRQPARTWSAQIGVKNAMDPYGATATARELPAPGRISDLLAPALLLSSPRAEGRKDERRR